MRWRAAVLSLLLSAAQFAQAADKFPPISPPKDPSVLGVGIQRTMTLLATSTPEKRNKVRVLFYGQSITEQNWTKLVTADLRQRFPNADLEIENRAIGAHASQLLVRVAEHDLYPFYPDLLIFHVYGGNKEYEEIIKNVRTRTTAEVLMQTDHGVRWPPETIDQKKDGGSWWDHMMNNVFLPEIAKKYGCTLIDIRNPWMDYLKEHKLEPKALLTDAVHLNDHGCFLLAGLINRYLVHRPDLAEDLAAKGVTTLEVGKDVQWKDGKLTLEFDGNRVDVIAGTEGPAGTAQVRIDGKKPSEVPELYAFTRPSVTQAGFWPAILRVSSEKPRLLEDWTLKITEASEDAAKLKFDLSGSKTGPDGSGTSEAKFTSTSGRVVIEPGDWRLKAMKKPVPPNFTVRWKCVPLFVDELNPAKPSEPGKEGITTIALGLANGKHTLELTGAVPIKAIRIYRPTVK